MKQKSTNVAKDQHENPARTQSIQFQSNQVIALDKGMHACVVEYGLYNVGTVPCRGGGVLTSVNAAASGLAFSLVVAMSSTVAVVGGIPCDLTCLRAQWGVEFLIYMDG